MLKVNDTISCAYHPDVKAKITLESTPWSRKIFYVWEKKVDWIMLIGEISLKTGLSRDTIRYYEKIGLIKINKRQRRDNNYKEYSAEIIERLEIIKRAKYLGFSLQEIKELIDAWANKTLTIDERIELFESRIALLDEKILRLNEVKSLIRKRIKQIKEEGQ